MSGSRCLRRGWGLAIAGWLIAGLIAVPASASSPHPQASTVDPALWVIRDADSTVYLFGTVHMLRAATVWETPRVMAALDASTDIWFEVDAAAGAADLPRLVAAHGLSSGRPLSRLLSPEDRRALSGAASRAGLTEEQLDGFRPWLASLIVGNAPMLEAGYDPAFGVETRLRERAAAAGKPVRGLETMEDQFLYLADLPEETQIDLLRYSIRSPETVLAEMDASVIAWTSGDMAGVERAVTLSMRRGSEPLYQAMLVRRSLLLADHLQTVLDGSGVAFVALGAGYLAGEDSVPSVLADRGVAVTRE